MFFIESYRPNRVFRFKIDQSFYLFVTYWLARIAQGIVKLSSTLFPINKTITSRGYIVYRLRTISGPQFKHNTCNFGNIKSLHQTHSSIS